MFLIDKFLQKNSSPEYRYNNEYIESYRVEIAEPIVTDDPPANNTNTLQAYAGQVAPAPYQSSYWDGDQFAGSFGVTQLQTVDYWTLRKRSAQLYNENRFARAIIRTLVTNEIHVGLVPEVSPNEEILGLEEDSLSDWGESVESRFSMWAGNPRVCDYYERSTFGEIQRVAKLEAYVGGDVLVVLRHSERTNTPKIQLIRGENVKTPLDDSNIRQGNMIKHGVELDSTGRHVAYHIRQSDGSSKRLAAFGQSSGRRLAWLVYGSDHRLDDVRGQPVLSIVMSALKDISRYSEATLRSATIQSMMAIYVKSGAGIGTQPFNHVGGVRQKTLPNQKCDSDADTIRQYTSSVPGWTMQGLEEGEEPVGFKNEAASDSYSDFEEALVNSMAYALRIPPEILKQSFNSNYSASQAAINEFTSKINLERYSFGENFCSKIYQEWLVDEVLNGRIKADGFLQTWRNDDMYAEFGAWTDADWYGSTKPSSDVKKQVQASQMAIETGLSTYTREARMLFGTKFSKNMKRQRKEAELLTQVNELKIIDDSSTSSSSPTTAQVYDLMEMLEDAKTDS